MISENGELIKDLKFTKSILNKLQNQLSKDDYRTYNTYLTNIQGNALQRQMKLANHLQRVFFNTGPTVAELEELEAYRRRVAAEHREIRNILEKIQAQSQQTTETPTMVEIFANTVANTLKRPAESLTAIVTQAVPDRWLGT